MFAYNRRTPADADSSFSIVKRPSSPVKLTCGPPHISRLKYDSFEPTVGPTVYTVGPTVGSKESYFSREICGGPHVSFTGELGRFTILKEESASAGVRRLYANITSHEPAGSNSEIHSS